MTTHEEWAAMGPVPSELDRELRLIADAIALVATGGSKRVTLSNLRLAEQLLVEAEQMAATVGVTVRPLWSTDESGLDLSIEASE
jgi:hypothetical protein